MMPSTSRTAGGQSRPGAQKGGEMLTTAENEMLTPVGPGTPCRELMRRYWHSEEADQRLQQQVQAHP
jgi:hypothetical protein